MRRLARQARRFPDLELEPLDTSGLDARDAQLAAAIDHAVTRRWLTLVAVLEKCLTRPWDRVEPDLQAVLMTGAAQLLFFDRIPEHAAISASVDLAKSIVRPGAGGFVNAVLRRVADLRVELMSYDEPSSPKVIPRSDGRAWRMSEGIFDLDRVRGLAQRTSHPEQLIAHWEATFGPEITTAIATHDLTVPPLIVAGIDDAAGETSLAPHVEPGYFVLTGDRAELEDLLARHPGARVQDPAAGRAAAATADLAPRVVMDLCAGRGTKTRQLAALHPEARILATDTDEARFRDLQATFRSHDRVEVIPFASVREHDATVDLLVLDVPCSNTGVLARRVEARYRCNAASLRSLVDLQRQIIADSIPLLSDEGHILYSTCSVEPAENVAQAQWLGKWHHMRLESDEELEPAGMPGGPPTEYRDGGYWAMLTRMRIVG